MDRFLFEHFIFPLNDELVDSIYNIILIQSQNKVEFNNIGYYNYYPQNPHGIQLILETNRENNKLNIENLFFHHTSSYVWKIKIIDSVSMFPNTYMASSLDDSGMIIIRLVNEAVLGKKIEKGDVIEAQVSAFAINGSIYETERDYEESIPKLENGEKYLIDDGALMPLDFIINNNAMLSEEEKNKKEHIRDCLLTYKGSIKYANVFNLNMFNIDLPNYFNVVINTQYGELPIFFTKDFLNEKMSCFGEGNVIAGDLFLSGDVCINEYDKYIKKNDLKIKGKNE